MVDRMRGWMNKPINGYGALVIVIVCCSLAAIGLVVSNAQRRNSEQRDCATLGADIAALSEVPPTMASGQRVLLARRDRYREIGCTPTLAPIILPEVPSTRPVPQTSPSR